MGDRIYTFPYEILVIWRRHHGDLTDEQTARFLRDPNVDRLGAFPNHVVDGAIRQTPKLSEALEIIRSTRGKPSPVSRPQPRRAPAHHDTASPAPRNTAKRKRRLAARLSAKNRWRKGGTFIRRAQVYADDQRDNPTEAEARLEMILKRMYLGTGRVQVQWIFGKPSAPYILDFFIPEVRLGIEVDGPIHDNPEVKANDEKKAWMARSIGITVRRITNETVLTSEPDILQRQIATWYHEAAKYGQSRKRRPR